MSRPFQARPTLRQALYALGGAVVLALLVFEGIQTHYLPTTVASVATGVLCVVALLVRPARLPVAATVAVGASLAFTVVTMNLTHRPEATPGLTEACALLLVVTRCARHLPLLRATALVVSAGFAAGFLLLRTEAAQWVDVATFVAPLVFFGDILALVLGLYLRQSDTLRARRRTADLQEQRLEYARELHDFVAHHVTAIVAQTKAVRFATAGGHAPPAADLDAMLASIEASGSEAMTSMRSMVSVLREPAGSAETRPGGTLAPLRPLVADFSRHGPTAELTLDPRLADRALAPQITTSVHRLVQESLTNIRKHGVAVGKVVVDVRLSREQPDRLEAFVADDGRGAGQSSSRGGGYGLLGLTERIEAAGGSLEAGRGEAGGWRVAAVLPLGDARVEAGA
ncbi:Sensor histidine kinase LiaS [Streptomyces sp. YIM 130001]|uniref:sensor histidine kinase n=1 Tax=Streptomyces sp. YIM 130001 TaxID=2259644 RepID=UPI000E650010|nr:histidine kinase [Streptomyces sp. YIM 130001]RII15946.1 Sensor histidine kinase LiaS [Streptomyces sp. YIM 130001]